MKLSDYVMQFLEQQGITTIFGYQGGSVTHLIDSLHKYNIRYVQNYHEQASAFGANAYAHVTGNFGVSIACSGPGATNLITGIANAYFDSIPCLFLTGQVSTHEMRTTTNIRQQGFQETDIVSIVKPISKFAITVLEPELIRFYLEKALYIMKQGRPGSVVLDIPHNIQAAEIDEGSLVSFFESEEYTSQTIGDFICDSKQVEAVVECIKSAKRPVVLVGGGARELKDTGILETIAEKCDMPIVTSLRGLDVIPHDHPNFCGFIGAFGNRYANFTVAYSDLLIVLGSRLDGRQTGDTRSFAKYAKIIHVDIDKNELSRVVEEKISIQSTCILFLRQVLDKIKNQSFKHGNWMSVVKSWKTKYPSFNVEDLSDNINPNEFIYTLSKALKKNAIISADVGQNQMWVAQSICLDGEKYILNSAGHGAMGYSLPAAIGAYFAKKNMQLICIAGDGGIQMNLQELQTISKEKIPAKIFIMNNQSLGMIRSYHEKWFKDRMFGSVQGFTSPNYEKLADAFGLTYIKIACRKDYEKLRELNNDTACLFEVCLSNTTQIVPEPSARRPIEDQFPLLDREEYNEIMKEAMNANL